MRLDKLVRTPPPPTDDSKGPAVSDSDEDAPSGTAIIDAMSPPPLPGRTSKRASEERAAELISLAHTQYAQGDYDAALATCEAVYETDAWRLDNLLLLGAVHFELKNFSESIFYNQQAIRIDSSGAEFYANLGNSLRELGDVDGAVQFYLKAIKLKPRLSNAYVNLGAVYMQQGKVKQAVQTFEMALLLDPELKEAHNNLGNLYKAQGKSVEAKKSFLEAIRISPDYATAWSNLAGIFKDEGDVETAIKYYHEAVRLSPGVEALNNLGNVLRETGRLREAKSAYKRALALRPDFACAVGNLGLVFYDEGEMDLAIGKFRYALQLDPSLPDVQNSLGVALQTIGKTDEAILSFRSALKFKPDHPHAYNNLGLALKDKHLVKEAMHCFTTACRLMPSFAAAHSNLGSMLKEQNKLEEALAHYAKAIEIDPSCALVYCNMGACFKDLGQLKDAITCFTKAVKLKPDFAPIYYNLAASYKEAARFEDAITCLKKAISLKPEFPDAEVALAHSLLQLCDWRTLEDDHKRIAAIVAAQLKSPRPLKPSLQPYHALSFDISHETRLQLVRAFAASVQSNASLLGMAPFRYKAKKSGARIRIGYVSANFGNHPSGHAMRGVFKLHDKNAFEVFCYATSRSDGSAARNAVEADAEHFLDVSDMSSVDIAKRIHADKVHVLVDLTGYTAGGRPEVFALRPSPIQINLAASHGTLGAPWMHYILSDKILSPSLEDSKYDEKVLLMPSTCFVNDYKQSARFVLDPDQCPRRDAFSIPEDRVVFANFGQSGKISPDTFDCWCRILKRVSNSVLWLVKFPPLAEVNLRAEAKARGVKDRQLVFTDVLPRDEHLKRGYLADMYLDTFPHCSYTTAADTLWAGTPIVTCPGEAPSSRIGASLVTAADMPSLIAKDMHEYEDIVVKLGSDMDKLWELRKRLEEKRLASRLFDTVQWVQEFEKGIKAVWQRHEDGLHPDHIDIASL